MRSLYLGSVVEKSGKSMVTLGLARNFKGRVGFSSPSRNASYGWGTGSSTRTPT